MANPLESIIEQIKNQANSWWGNLSLSEGCGDQPFETYLLNSVRSSMVAHGFKGASIHESSFRTKGDQVAVTFDPVIEALKSLKFGIVYHVVGDDTGIKNVHKCLLLVSEIGAVHMVYNNVTVIATSKENLLRIKKVIDI